MKIYSQQQLVQGIVHQCLQQDDMHNGPYTPTTVIILAVPATDNSPVVPERTIVETVFNMSPKNKAHFKSEKETIHLILSGIGDEIYSTVYACKTTHKMWEVIERLQQGESLNIQDVKKNLFWEFGQFTSHDGETIESYTPEVNELRVERIANNANPLALVATAQPYQDPYYQTSKSHKFNPASRHNIKAFTSNPDSCNYKTQRQRDTKTILYLHLSQLSKKTESEDNDVARARETVGGHVVQQSGIQCFNCKEFGHFAKECKKPKRVKDSTYHKEKDVLCKQAEKCVQLQVEQSDWLADTDEEI
ncbi:retrovirus-related pol polyprotein from transposon TNT 1-94 [Tanacetum coccineum]